MISLLTVQVIGLLLVAAREARVSPTIYVDLSNTTPGDGSSWQEAYTDLQSALLVAAPGTEVWVATGVYRPDMGTLAKDVSFIPPTGVLIFGGFAGTETLLGERNP